VYFYDNLIINPDGVQSQWQQFQIDGPLDPAASSSVPSPSLADDDLRIAGNVIWNGPADHQLGVGDGCAPDNSTCNEAQILADNAINTTQPQLRDPANGDFSLTDESRAAMPATVPIPDFVWDATPLPVPPGDTVVAVDAAMYTAVGAK
jgi:hypothetical protein